MIVKFTCASKRDNKKVTVRVSELFDPHMSGAERYALLSHMNKVGNLIIMDINGITTVFKVNRAGVTLTTDAFPGKLSVPRVGKPVTYNVSNIKPVLNSFSV